MIRNRGCAPTLKSEGQFLKALVPLEKCRKVKWAENVEPFERMHIHQTLASARRFALFVPFKDLIPKDALDFKLASSYNHSEEIFPEAIDVLLQNETIGKPTWRRLRNTTDLKKIIHVQLRDVQVELEPQRAQSAPSKPPHKRAGGKITLPYKYNFAHPVLIGGVTERKHPSHIKLMNSSHHSSQTNAGYSRQPSDGNVYQY